MTHLMEIFKDAMPVIRTSAPLLAGVIGGPVGFVLSKVVPVIASAFDTHPANLADLVTRIATDPAAAHKLQDIAADNPDWFTIASDSVNNLAEADVHINLKWQNN